MPNPFAFHSLMSSMRRFLRDARGNMMVVTTVATFAIVGASSLVLDHGRKSEARDQLQKIADLAAQAAASPSALPGDPQEAKARRREIAENYVRNSTADVTEALSADRPYRGGMPVAQVTGILDSLVAKQHLDGAATEALKATFLGLPEAAMGASCEVRAA